MISMSVGFIFISNPFKRGYQRYWTWRCLYKYHVKPNKTNLDIHAETESYKNIWDERFVALSVFLIGHFMSTLVVSDYLLFCLHIAMHTDRSVRFALLVWNVISRLGNHGFKNYAGQLLATTMTGTPRFAKYHGDHSNLKSHHV